MRILYALLCENASAREDGRLDVQGIFHQLYAPGFPAQQDAMMLAVALEWEPEEAGRREFRIDLLDPEASPSLTINGHTDVTAPAPGEAPPQTRLVMPLEGTVFPQAGTYRFQLHYGDERLLLTPLHLVETPAE